MIKKLQGVYLLLFLLISACSYIEQGTSTISPTSTSVLTEVPETPTLTRVTETLSPTIPTISSIFPLCQPEPEVAYVGSTIAITARSLPVNHPVSVFIGTQQVGTGQTDNEGNISVSVLIPMDTVLGLNQVSIYADGTAVAAECVLNALSSIQSSPTGSPTLTPTTLSNSSIDIRDSIRIWRSYIGVHGQKDHFIFHVVTEDTLLIPKSIQILDVETGQVTNPFPLRVSPFPNLCAAEPRQGKSYYRTEEVFFDNLPPDFWERLNGTSFIYLVEIEQPTGEQVSVAITDTPGGCTNLVE